MVDSPPIVSLESHRRQQLFDALIAPDPTHLHAVNAWYVHHKWVPASFSEALSAVI